MVLIDWWSFYTDNRHRKFHCKTIHLDSWTVRKRNCISTFFSFQYTKSFILKYPRQLKIFLTKKQKPKFCLHILELYVSLGVSRHVWDRPSQRECSVSFILSKLLDCLGQDPVIGTLHNKQVHANSLYCKNVKSSQIKYDNNFKF